MTNNKGFAGSVETTGDAQRTSKTNIKLKISTSTAIERGTRQLLPLLTVELV